MFKLPLLQPHLTGTNGIEGKTGSGISKYSPFIRSARDASGGGDPLLGSANSSMTGNVEVKDWESQAKDITADVTSSDKYKSIALHAEVKLAEALERCTRVLPTAYTDDGEEKPNKLKTAVCCQLLGEFADLCGPFSNVLKNIKDELVQAIYSPLFVSEKGLLVFDQLPWFSVAERLEAEKAVMVEERAKFEQMMLEQQAMIERIEEQLGVYQRATATAQLDAAGVRSKLDALIASEESSRLEAKTGREELKRLRKDWMRMRDDLDGEKSKAARAKESSDQEISGLRSQIRALKTALEAAHAEAAEAQDHAAICLPPAAVSALQESVTTAEAALDEARRRIKELEGFLKEANAVAGTMTPRPSFRELKKYGVEDAAAAAAAANTGSKGGRIRTQELVDAAAARLAVYAASRNAARAAAELGDAVLAPEPAPAEVTLAVTTDTSAYFITEGGEEGAGSGQALSVAVEGLGTGPGVPRCLRWPNEDMVSGLDSLDVGQAQSLVWDIIRAKQAHDSCHPAEHMQAFLYHYCAQAAKAHMAAAASGKAKQKQVQISTGEAAADEQPPGALHADVVRRAYGIYHAASSHARASPLLRMFWEVLTGKLPEAALTDIQLHFATLLGAARASSTHPAADGDGSVDVAGDDYGSSPPSPAGGTVATSFVHDILAKLAPSRPPYRVSRLQDAYSSNVAAESVSLSDLEELLQPLAWRCDPERVSAAVESDMKAASAAPLPERASLAGQLQPSASPSPTPADESAKGVGELLSHPFISMFVQQHLEDLQQASSEALEAVQKLPEFNSLHSSSHRMSLSGVAAAGTSAATILGGQVGAQAVMGVLRSVGLAGEHAARAVAAAAGTASSSGAALDGGDLATVLDRAGTEAKVWCGLVLSKLASEVLLKPVGVHGVQAVMASITSQE